jgi:hypothetical protein
MICTGPSIAGGLSVGPNCPSCIPSNRPNGGNGPSGPGCSCLSGCSDGGNGTGGGQGGCDCQPGLCPVPPPSTGNYHTVYVLIANGGGNRLRGLDVLCAETGVTYGMDCLDTRYYYTTPGTKTYSTPGGRAGHCMWLNIHGTAGSGQSTGEDPGDVAPITVGFTPD